MKQSLHLEAYFNRIGFKGRLKPNLSTLCQLHIKHTQTIPFENLYPLLGLPVKLDIDSLQNKMIKRELGGYCFEQNILFCAVLKQIGFHVTPLAGRVLLNTTVTDVPEKTHMLLLVHIGDQDYIADVGFGGQSLTGPLRFDPGVSQQTPHENYRILEKDDHYRLQVHLKNRWKTLYRFTLQKRYPADYKVANWYTSTHPDSHFTKGLTLARAGNDCRYVMTHERFAIHHLNGKTEKYKLNQAKEIIDLCYRCFGVKVPFPDRFKEIIHSLIAKD